MRPQDTRARKNTPLLRREAQELGNVVELFQQSVCMIDEVRLLLRSPIRKPMKRKQ